MISNKDIIPKVFDIFWKIYTCKRKFVFENVLFGSTQMTLFQKYQFLFNIVVFEVIYKSFVTFMSSVYNNYYFLPSSRSNSKLL